LFCSEFDVLYNALKWLLLLLTAFNVAIKTAFCVKSAVKPQPTNQTAFKGSFFGYGTTALCDFC